MQTQPISSPRLGAAAEFIWRESALLDQKHYDEWLELWEPSGMYVVPIDPKTEDFASCLNYVYDNDEMRRKRVQRMTSGYSVSSNDSASTVRTVSRFTVFAEDGDVLKITSAQILIAYKREVTTIFAANLSHTLSFASGQPQLKEKVVRLINATDALNSTGFLL